MSSFDLAHYKFLRHPIELTRDDIAALRVRDPWLAKKAFAAFEDAMDAESERLDRLGTKTKPPSRPPVRVMPLKRR